MPHAPINPKAFGYFAIVLLILAAIVIAFEYRAPSINAPAPAEIAASVAASDAFEKLSISAKSAIVIDLTNGKTLFAHNPDAQLPLASLAKIPLAIVVSEVLPPDAILSIPQNTSPLGSAEHLGKGERWRVRDIIDFTLVASSNGGADILAKAADGPLRARYRDAPEGNAAIWRMNQLARELGLSRTYFLNASGLDESNTISGAYGSARDVANLFAYAEYSHPSIFSGTAESGLNLVSANGRGKTSAFNTNEALSDIPGLAMGKTGITDLAGGNLAIVFDVGLAHPVVIVVLGSTREGRFEDMRLLVDKTRQAIAKHA